MKTRRRQVRERIRLNRWRRRRRWHEWDIGSLEIRIGGVLLTPPERAALNAGGGDWLVVEPPS